MKKNSISRSKKFSLFFIGAPYGPVKIGIARPVTDDNGSQIMMNQLRGRLAAEAAEAAAASAEAEASHNNEEVILLTDA